MIFLKSLHPGDYERLHPIVVAEEPFAANITPEQLKAELVKRDGWTVWDDETLIGAITLTALVPLLSVVLHAVIDIEYQGKWVSLRILRQVFSYLFNDLELRRVSSYAIPYKTTEAAKMLTAMGFRVEGVTECGGRTAEGEFYDVVNYGMLAERCPWLWEKDKLRSWLKWRKESGVM